MRLKITLFTVTCMIQALVSAQAEELISGDVLSHFRPTTHWHLVNDVAMSEADPSQLVSQPDQSGRTLLNSNRKTRELPYLLTRDSFKDLDLSLEFMIPKGSNAGVYLMGRYEIQIFDSYGVKRPKFSDMGGVYQRYHEADTRKPGQKPGYEGVPPLVNAAKVPGEWQRLDVKFRAPRFDAEGSKTENARFISVHLNGQLVQQNVEVTGPTRSHPIKEEAATGPVSIQGDHGPVAIRSFIVNPIENQ